MYAFKNKLYIILFAAIDAIGYVICAPFRLIFRVNPPVFPKKILIIRLDHIGDVISSVPVFENLKMKLPGSQISLLLSSWSSDIVKNDPFLDEVIIFDAPWFKRKSKSGICLLSFLKLALRLRKAHFDLGIDLRGDFRHILLMFLAGVRYKVGYGITGGGFLLEEKPEYRMGVNAIEHNLDILRSLKVPILETAPKLYISDHDRKAVESLMSQFGLEKNSRFAVMHTVAGYPSKNWLGARFAKLASIVSGKYDMQILLVGTEEDRSDIDQIIALSGSVRVHNAAGMTSLAVLTGLISNAALFVGVDSGPSHIASSQNVPTVVIYSATNKASEWLFGGKNTEAIQKDVTCSGCQKLFCDHNQCMELISVEDALDAINRVLNKKA